jgi:chemotaxis family two-component system response regulator Rcp1
MLPLETINAVDILLVEDNPGDVRLTREALKEGKILNNLYVAGDGAMAWQFLTRTDPFVDAPRPNLILLDLNLPKMDGRELLGLIKAAPELKAIPVVVLTTSQAEQDILASYELHANCFITKPVDLEQFLKVIQTIEDFWFSIVRLPPERAPAN